VPIIRRDYYQITGTCRDENDIVKGAGLEQVMSLTFEDLIDLRETHPPWILRVVMPLRLDPFAAEIAGRDHGQVVTELVLVQPLPVRIGPCQVTVHKIEGLAAPALRVEQDGMHLVHRPFRRRGKLPFPPKHHFFFRITSK